jgi:hypothetical protein
LTEFRHLRIFLGFAAAAAAAVIAACGAGGGQISAMHVVGFPSPIPSPIPSPSPSGGVPPAAPLRGPVIADTWANFGLFQPFDGLISSHQATSDASRYVIAWGPGKPLAWLSGNPQLNVSYYLPFDTDADIGGFGALGHPLSWWQSASGHPDWILYQCDRSTPAWVNGLPQNVPLDISNPAVVAYQMALVGPYMQANGYNALAADVISLHNGNGGCGVWTQNHTVWVPKFSGQTVDAAWATAVLYWVTYAQWYLHAQPRQEALLVNAPIASEQEGDTQSEAFVSHIDALQDEGGFTNFGSHIAGDAEFRTKTWWMSYVQSLGKAFMIADLWKGAEPDGAQREFAIAAYLEAKGHFAAMFTSQYGQYGSEHYWPEYTVPVGTPCGDMQSEQGAYVRALSLSLVIVNTSTSTVDVTLPQPASAYTDIEGLQVTQPMPVSAQSGLVLLTANGCD